MTDTSSIDPNVSSFSLSTIQHLQAISKLKKLTTKLQQLQLKSKSLQSQKNQLIGTISQLTLLNQTHITHTQVIQNNLQNLNNLLKIQKKENQVMKKQMENLRRENSRQAADEQILELNNKIGQLVRQLAAKQQAIGRLTAEINVNSDFTSQINSMSQLVTKARQQTQQHRTLYNKQKQQKQFYKNSLTSSIEKRLVVQQEYSRHRRITKNMMEELKVGFEKEKKGWKRCYVGNLEFYKEEYELFKGFVEEVLGYLKRRGLCGEFESERPGVRERVEGRV